MESFFAGIDPLYAIGSNVNLSRIRSKEDASREFASLFISQILKEVFKNQGSMFGEEGSLGMFSDNLYNDILISKISGDLAASKSFGFDKLVAANTSSRIDR
jgi:Rod binding domain-containing protein